MAEIKTRKELYAHLESTMFGTYKDIIEDGEYEKGRNLLKTFLYCRIKHWHNRTN